MSNILAQIRQRSVNVTVDDSIDIFTSTYKEKDKVFNEDPLLLSCSLKNLIGTDQSYYSMDDPRVVENITDEIREEAEKIRKYFGKKFFWTNLTNGRSLSDFRGRTCYLLENRVRTCKEQDVGIYYKLPYFYEEDMIYDDFKKNYETVDVPQVNRGRIVSGKTKLSLTYVKTTTSRQRKRNIQRFWFTDGTYLYNIEIASDNPLLDMFNQLVVEKMTVTFDTYYNIDRIDQMYFYKLYKFSLAKETNA